jgi:hypothetical protein
MSDAGPPGPLIRYNTVVLSFRTGGKILSLGVVTVLGHTPLRPAHIYIPVYKYKSMQSSYIWLTILPGRPQNYVSTHYIESFLMGLVSLNYPLNV